MDLLNKRNGLRRLLSDAKHRDSGTSIPKEDVNEEAEVVLRDAIERLVACILADPRVLLVDEYTEEERKKDWAALRKKSADTFESRSRLGHKILDHHMPHFWNVKNHKGNSVAGMITAEALRKAIWLNVRMHSTPYKSEIRRTIVLSSGMSSVTKYRAGVSKHIVKKYGAKTVLDPCVGWGGRMLGSLAGESMYSGFEPDPNTFGGLQGILKDVGMIADVRNEPAETGLLKIPSGTFDLVLTSPPYYNLEMYTAGDQSVKEQSWEEWVEGWLKPVVKECLRCLKPEGKSCWSVKNFKSDKKYPLADVVRDIHAEMGWVLFDTISVSGPGRPGAKKASEEETFVYANTARSAGH